MLKYLGKAFRAVFAQHLIKVTVPAQGSTVNDKRPGFWTSQFRFGPHEKVNYSSSTNAIFKKKILKKFILAE